MKITALTAQQKQANRVNVMVDGVYRFSLDVFQVADLGIRVGREYSEKELVELETESQFGKLYGRTLEYTMIRPHSAREIRDYLWRKTRSRKVLLRHKAGKSMLQGGTLQQIKEVPGVSQAVADRVFDRLCEKGYIDDEKFARFWVENRNQRKGSSVRKLKSELQAKGVESSIIDTALASTTRSDEDELAKIIAKKRARYPDEQKFMQYLARQGFSYDDIKEALSRGP
ncbi:RecX family transcriptional regulator [Candidatus Saccharibacteria bacterium]|nr:MAG: RecX family transcriptional regulator [Candidatus Saccharibacteria bacterium]